MKEGASPSPATNPKIRLKVFSSPEGSRYSRSAVMHNILSGYGILFVLDRASMKRAFNLHRTTALLLTIVLAVPAWTVSSGTPQLPNPGSVGMSREEQGKLGLQAMTEVYKQMPVLPDS